MRPGAERRTPAAARNAVARGTSRPLAARPRARQPALEPERTRADNARMPFVPVGSVLLPAPAVFALLALIAVLPVPLLAVWRADVLARPADVERPAWFAWVTRVQVLLLASGLVTPAVTARLPVRPALLAMGIHSPLVASTVALLLSLAPVVVHFALAVAWSAGVERRLRGISPDVGERLARFAAGLGTFAPLVAGLVLSAIATTNGRPDLGVSLLLAGVLGLLFVASTRSLALGLVPQALTTGPLRERITELAARAGTAVHHVHVLGAESVRMANAFALRGGRVLLTDHLLSQLSRREVDAIVAHELAHLKESHPLQLQLALLGAGALAAPLLMLPIGPAAFVLPGIVGYAAFLFVSRRFEYVADRRAAEWTGDAAALVSGLVRLARINHYPVAWSRAREWTLTHPSTRRRAEALVAKGLLPAEQARALLAAPADDAERWPVSPASSERVFGTPARHAQSALASWALLVACALPAVLVIAAADAFAPALPRLVLLASASTIAFVAAWFTADVASLAGFRRWRRALAARLSPPEDALFVAVGPYDPGVVYENYADWDLGFLTLEPGWIRVRGEQCTFALPSDRVMGVLPEPGLPGWHPTPRVAVTWLDETGEPRTFVLRDADARSLREFPARTERLQKRLDAWKQTPGPGPREGAPPDATTVSGTPFSTLVAPPTLVPVALLLALLVSCVAPLAGLPLAPWSGAGALDAFVAGMLAVIALRVPVWHAGGRSVPAPRATSLDRAA